MLLTGDSVGLIPSRGYSNMVSVKQVDKYHKKKKIIPVIVRKQVKRNKSIGYRELLRL